MLCASMLMKVGGLEPAAESLVRPNATRDCQSRLFAPTNAFFAAFMHSRAWKHTRNSTNEESLCNNNRQKLRGSICC
jgi:hypothetical protein